MATNSAKAHIYGNKEKKRKVAAIKKNSVITDCLTAKSAKTYVYGYKEQKQLAAVIDMNVYVDECMTFVPPEPEPLTITAASNSNFSFLTFAFWFMSVFLLYTAYGLVLYYLL